MSGKLIAWTAALLHVAASFAMLLVLRHGFEGTAEARAAYILSHRSLWIAGWGAWMAGAVALCAFNAWWASRLGWPRFAKLAVAVATVGATCDWFGELHFIAEMPRHLEQASRIGQFVTTVFANGLYSLAGAMLTIATPGMPKWLRAWSWAIWITGFAMVGGGLVWSTIVIQVTTGMLCVLVTPWFVAMAAAERQIENLNPRTSVQT